jgi:membrane-bound metal-dependent hydrolase YbcI (DUF457 family)
MLFRTHVVSFLLLFVLFFEKIDNALIFLFLGLFFTVFPDIDSPNSRVGKFFISKVKIEVISFAFLVGFCLHLILDCFTRRGVRIFYPFRFKIKGPLRSGGRMESVLFILISLLVLFLLAFKVYSLVL